MKTILLAEDPTSKGGIGEWTLRMLGARLEHGWTVGLVDEKILGKREVFGNKTRRNYFFEIKRCLKIWNSLNKQLGDPDAVVVQSCIPAGILSIFRELVCLLITKLHKRKFIIHFRCTVPNMIHSKFHKKVLSCFCKHSDHIIALNQKTSHYLNGITDTPVTVIPNFVNTEETNKKREINGALKNILYVGGVIKTKGCMDIIDVARQCPDITFRLVGKASDEVVRYAENINNVMLAGEKDKGGVLNELEKADAFIFLSYFEGEGFSNALAEAMGNALPCIVSDWAANSEMIDNGYGGYVVKPRDIEATVEAVNKIRDRGVRERMSEHNVNKVFKEYIDEVVLKKYVDCYEVCISKCCE